MRTDEEEDMSSCIEVIPSPFGDGVDVASEQRQVEREEGSPDTTITTSSSYIATRHLGSTNLSTADSQYKNKNSF